MSFAMKPDRETSAAERVEPAAQSAEPLALYFPSCGALCDVFWWARRTRPASPDVSGGAATNSRSQRA